MSYDCATFEPHADPHADLIYVAFSWSNAKEADNPCKRRAERRALVFSR